MIAVLDVRFTYFEPSDPVIVADPGAAGLVPKSKTGVRVVLAPVRIIAEPAVRLVALAGGTTLIVADAVTDVPLEGETVSV